MTRDNHSRQRAMAETAAAGGQRSFVVLLIRRIISARLLDLYEGEILDGLRYRNQVSSIDDALHQITLRLGRLNQFLIYDFDDALKMIQANIEFLPGGYCHGARG